MTFREKTLRLSSIDVQSESFRISTEKDCTVLARSIQAAGLINPPLLYGTDSGFGVVSGFRRIAACRLLGQQSLQCRVADPDTPGIALAKTAVLDNTSQRPLNWVEQANAVRLLSRYSSGGRALSAALTDVGLPAGPAFVAQMTAAGALSQQVKEGVIAGRIAPPAALRLGRLDKTDAAALCVIFRQLNLSLNKQLEVLTLSHEISRRENITVARLLEEPAICSMLGPGSSDQKAAAETLRRYLRQRRFPEISMREREFENLKKSLLLPGHIQLHPPQHFENKVYTVRMTFSNREEVAACRRAIERILRHPDIIGDLD